MSANVTSLTTIMVDEIPAVPFYKTFISFTFWILFDHYFQSFDWLGFFGKQF